MELQRATAPQLRREKAAECCGGQADTHLLFPTRENREDSQLQVLLCRTVKSKQRGAERHRGWRRIREQTKQTTHRRSPKLTAKQVVNNPPVGVSLAPQKQEQRRQRDWIDTFIQLALEAADMNWANWSPVARSFIGDVAAWNQSVSGRGGRDVRPQSC